MTNHYYICERDWSQGGAIRNEFEGDFTESEITEMQRTNPNLRVFLDYARYMHYVND